MATVYERIDQLCKQKGVTHGKMCNDLGYSRTTMSALKSGRSTTLKLEKAQRIADYFGVTVDYLLGNDTKKEPNVQGNRLSELEKKNISKKVESLMKDLEDGGDLMFDGDPMSPEAMDDLRRALMVGYQMVRERNKEKKKDGKK